MKVETAVCLIFYNWKCYTFAGYMTYISAVRIDAAHNNPVMNVFIYFLSQRNINSYRSTSMYSCVWLCVHVCTYMYMCMYVCAYIYVCIPSSNTKDSLYWHAYVRNINSYIACYFSTLQMKISYTFEECTHHISCLNYTYILLAPFSKSILMKQNFDNNAS